MKGRPKKKRKNCEKDMLVRVFKKNGYARPRCMKAWQQNSDHSARRENKPDSRRKKYLSTFLEQMENDDLLDLIISFALKIFLKSY